MVRHQAALRRPSAQHISGAQHPEKQQQRQPRKPLEAFIPYPGALIELTAGQRLCLDLVQDPVGIALAVIGALIDAVAG